MRGALYVSSVAPRNDTWTPLLARERYERVSAAHGLDLAHCVARGRSAVEALDALDLELRVLAALGVRGRVIPLRADGRGLDVLPRRGGAPCA